ncbi:glycosyltransferase [Alkalinema sp. FACHB-956]|uniref:glycosyltransferase n=1 Tax=Alkalinema sp. FACHB-956 TaxID=2692768 RepID=UPI001682DD6A|nr:glycosyltransferase [Alkalinema sp. FACHB-956]MBD2325686.1 glycosyltransferase [Alkalinema sp. FACHB-956]
MRKLYFLLPGTSGKFACGGLWAELKTLQFAQQICPAQIVTYRQREPQHLFLDDLLQQQPHHPDSIFIISWGFDIPKLIRKLHSNPTLYHAHSAGYNFRLPAHIPIVTVSRNTLGYWGQHAPHSPIYYLPNQISDNFHNRHQPRDIDILIQARKSSTYLLTQLIPALQSQCRVEIVDYYVEDLSILFNRSKVYLYDSAEYWAQRNVTEGFGLQPLEAMACGCHVFSSVNHGLSDYLDPSFNSQKIASYSTQYDRDRILQTLHQPPIELPPHFLAEYRTENILSRLQHILTEVNTFFDYMQQSPSDIAPLTPSRITQLRLQSLWKKLHKKLKR